MARDVIWGRGDVKKNFPSFSAMRRKHKSFLKLGVCRAIPAMYIHYKRKKTKNDMKRKIFSLNAVTHLNPNTHFQKVTNKINIHFFVIKGKTRLLVLFLLFVFSSFGLLSSESEPNYIKKNFDYRSLLKSRIFTYKIL